MGQDGRIGSDEDFSGLLQSLYAGATDLSRMSDFLVRLAEASGAHTGAMQIHDSHHSQGEILLSVGALDSAEARRYNDSYGRDNVWIQRGAAQLVAQGLVSGSEIISAAELMTTDFYQEFLQPLDIHDSFGLLLWQGDAGEVALMTVNRSRRQGIFGDEQRHLLTRLLPHLQNVYAIQQRLSWADQERVGLLAALDRLRFGVLLCDGGGRVRVINEMAGSLLGGRVDTGHRLGELPGFDAADRAELSEAIDHAARPPLLLRRRLALRNEAGIPELIALVLPLPASGFSDVGVSSARVAVFLHPLRRPIDADDREALLVELYGLSPVQARLARLLCTGLDLPQCAELLGNRMHTIKSQLKAIYRKTGCHRQGELIALLGELLRD